MNKFIRLILLSAVLCALGISPALAQTKHHAAGKNISSKKSQHSRVNPKPHSADYMTGVASCYAEKFIGRRTTSGDIFTMNRFTGAHPTLPMGVKLKITNLRNNKVVYILVNDRMAKKSGHVIDLPYLAAHQLGICPGLGHVQLELMNNDAFHSLFNGQITQALISANPLLSTDQMLIIANQFANGAAGLSSESGIANPSESAPAENLTNQESN